MKYKLKTFARIALPVPVVLGAAWWVNKTFRKEVNPMNQQTTNTNQNNVTSVDIQNCIDRCTQTAQRIRNIANDMVDHRARLSLAEADRHIELCIHNCLDAKSMTNA